MTVPGFLSEKTLSREKVTSLFVTEIKVHIFACSLLILCMEEFLLIYKEPPEFSRGLFVLYAMAVYIGVCLLKQVFKIFTGTKMASIVSILPVISLYFLLKNKEQMQYFNDAIIVAVSARLFSVFLPGRERVILFGSFVMDAAALYLHFASHVFNGSFFTDRLLFSFLTVLTLASLQKILYERKGDFFPFYYFILIGLILIRIPMDKNPIDWTPVTKTGNMLVNQMMYAADGLSYFLSSAFSSGSYSAGYSSLNVTGEKVERKEKTQIRLKTKEDPFYIYTDNGTTQNMKMRRTIYLAGGRGVDGNDLVHFIQFMYEKGLDKEQAALFSKISNLDVEYVYLNTYDEIAPEGSLMLYTGHRKIATGISDSIHKKGYKINCIYLDVDYGSPYLTSLFRDNKKSFGSVRLSYEQVCDYFMRLYGLDFCYIMGAEEYEAFLDEDVTNEYIDISGTTDRMAKLAEDITLGVDNEYDKCKRVETYLRQYKYSTDAAGGWNPQSDMTTSEGMSDIAERFMYERGTGYCVHYTSSMVMLLRLAGIPARAVCGYRYVFPFEKEDSYDVSSNCAHIWPEAYLNGVGWIPFEPTTAYRTAEDFTWHREAIEKYGFEQGNKEKKDSATVLPEVPEGLGALTENESKESTASRIFKVVWPVTVSFLIVLMLLVFGTLAAGSIKYMKGTPEKKLQMDVAIIKRSIRKQVKEKFTDRGLLSDYIENTPEELRAELQSVFDVYYRITYGGHSAAGVSPEENELAKKVRERITNKKGLASFLNRIDR